MFTDLLRRLNDVVRRKRPEKWRSSSWFLLHDNAPAHRLVFIKDFLAKKIVTTLQHSPYPPVSSRYLPVLSTEINTEGTVLL